MKKTTILITLTLVTLLFAGCGSPQAQINQISADTAKNTALEAAGISASEVTFITAELDERDEQRYYDVDFAANGQQYDYDIDALTGAVIDGIGTAETQPSTGHQNDGLIGEEKAKELALSHAGVTNDQVTFVKSGLDRDDGRLVYDVEFYGKDYTEYDYDIDAATGEILSFDADAEYYTRPSDNSGTSANGITEAQAKEIALSQVPGASESDIREFEVDYDDGRFVYEGKIYYDRMEYEFEIDGYSSAIRNWEVESIYD